MAIPHRGFTLLDETYFITANAVDKKNLLQSDRMASLLLQVLFHYRDQGHFLLHEFVIMPNHLHLLLTPRDSKLEKCMQLIKGNFSYRAKKELSVMWSVWQGSYYDRRVRTQDEYNAHQHYIRQNPVVAGLCESPDGWPWSSATANDGLKP
jgi:putative transposase